MLEFSELAVQRAMLLARPCLIVAGLRGDLGRFRREESNVVMDYKRPVDKENHRSVIDSEATRW